MDESFTPPPYNQQAVHSQKMSAGVLAIVLGAVGLGFIGVHKFMLGFTNAGLISLIVTICTCFIAGVVFNIISIIEGVIYLTKTDEEFYQLYVAGQKDWF